MWAPPAAGRTVSVALVPSRFAVTTQPAVASGSSANAFANPAATVALTPGAPALTGSVSETLASPGMQESWHMSHSAAAVKVTDAPAATLPGGVISVNK